MTKKLCDISPEVRGMLRSLAAGYSTVFLVDLTTWEYIVIKAPFALGSQYRQEHTFFEDSGAFLKAGAKPEYHERICDYLNLSNMVERLKEKDTLEPLLFESVIPGHKWISLSVRSGLRIPSGRCVLAFVTISDLDPEKRRQEEQLRELNEIIEANRMGTWKTCSVNGQPTGLHASLQMQKLLGLEPNTLTPEEMHKHWFGHVPESERPKVEAYFAKLFSGERDEVLYIWNHPTLGPRYVRCGGIGHIVSENESVVHGYHYDVTEQVLEDQAKQRAIEEAREQAEAANAAKTSFLFNMSHDIRTPMNAIIGFTKLLRKYQEDADRRSDYLDKIESSSTVLLSIINNVLEMARIEKGAIVIEENVGSPESYVDGLYSIFYEDMEQKGIEFTRKVEVEHTYVYCDLTKLREIFINLLSNACKYTQPGGKVNLHVRELPYDREGWVLLQATVSDTGMGMSEEFLPHIFDEFARENNTTENKIVGTGLGMAIVKRLVTLMNGQVHVESSKGVGTTITVTIPHRIAEKPDAVKNDDIDLQPEMFSGKRVLLAEDNDLNAEIAMEILAETGLVVDRAEDGIIALDMVRNSPVGYYDVILMDIQMPRMNGYDSARAIRRLDDDRKNIPILAMTANAFEEDKREAIRAGMNAHLTKPINISELMKTLAFYT